MKKLFSILIISAIFAGFLSAQAISAKVVSITGKVEIMKGNAWHQAAEGETLVRGDIISTGFNSQAVLNVKDSTITLSALTRMTVEQLAENDVKSQTQLFIDTGKVTANVKHAENKRTDFKVRSPVSTASVRGTNFTVSATGEIATTEGMVAGTASTSQTAQVAQTDTPSDYLPLEASSTVFTSTSELSEGKGTPVYEGQATMADEMTGEVISTQLKMLVDAYSVGGFSAATGSSLAENGLSTLSAIGSNTSSTNIKDEKIGTLILRLSITSQ
ncbi:FecR domain-containing protein [Treponema sp. C6A8]|uniref:FecR family protein n=1 Tax=Treponema sp. C6A8 TaxID=1410609 RepID=UPI00068878FE|nr:FecR domain-containing protein [Treponema sp. C6A8]